MEKLSTRRITFESFFLLRSRSPERAMLFAATFFRPPHTGLCLLTGTWSIGGEIGDQQNGFGDRRYGT
jgi:hypothetical protein